jgi:predicted TIM-barrel fold metal-dependent hydrolase
MAQHYPDIPLSEYRPKPLLERPAHVPERARFPVVDAHNHLMDDPSPESMLEIMDRTGVKTFINLTGNTRLSFPESGYSFSVRDIGFFIDGYVREHPGRFACFTMSDFANIEDPVLIKDGGFAGRAADRLEDDVKRGASGLKVTKELGLKFTDDCGSFVPVDDRRLDPVWEKAGKLEVPVLIHTSDPVGFFLPIDGDNEHYPTLRKTPGWSFFGSRYSKMELLAQRNRMIERHPKTVFICAHVGNYPENLSYVAGFLDAHPNAFVDISARIDELGRQPYTARDFMVSYRDRILFGIDMPVRADVYRAYFRFLETSDEYFEHPDYFGNFGNSRWRIYGLGLPDDVLIKVYGGNARRIIPGLSA